MGKILKLHPWLLAVNDGALRKILSTVMRTMWGVTPVPFDSVAMTLDWLDTIKVGDDIPEVAIVELCTTDTTGVEIAKRLRQNLLTKDVVLAFVIDGEEALKTHSALLQDIKPELFLNKQDTDFTRFAIQIEKIRSERASKRSIETTSPDSTQPTITKERPPSVPIAEPSTDLIGGFKQEAPVIDQKTASYLPVKKLTLFVHGFTRPIIIQTDRALLGRRDTTPEEIDLTPFNALENGVSRRHAEIVARNGAFFVKDVGSINGSWLNGKPLTKDRSAPIVHDDVLRLGNLIMRVVIKDEKKNQSSNHIKTKPFEQSELEE